MNQFHKKKLFQKHLRFSTVFPAIRTETYQVPIPSAIHKKKKKKPEEKKKRKKNKK